jgi:hypothetical protein
LPYNLTDDQKDLVRWMVQEYRAGKLPEEFRVGWSKGGGSIMEYPSDHPEVSQGALDALHETQLVVSDINLETKLSKYGSSKRPKVRETRSERSRRCRLTARAFEGVDSDFHTRHVLHNATDPAGRCY